MSRGTLIRGAAILGAAGLVVKILGAVFRIPLVNWIGDIGMANYNPAYYIYNFFLVLATAGIPIAISKMVSERIAVGHYGEAHKVYKISFGLMGAIGVISFVILFVFAPQISNLVNNPQAELAMRAIAPCLIFVPTMAALRGYFQGMQNMRPTAISQIVEQFFRVVVGLSLAYVLFNLAGGSSFAAKYDAFERGAAGAAFGATAGSIGGLLIILLVYGLSKKSIHFKIRHSHNEEFEPTGLILKRIMIIAIPITIGAAIMPITNLVDVTIVIGRLQDASIGYEEAKGLYGQLGGFVGSLVYLPQVLIYAVAISLVPLISAAHRVGDTVALKENVSLGVRLACIIGFPCAAGLMALSEPIMLLIYPAQAESAISAAQILFTMSVGIFFLSASQTLTGVLQGVGKQAIPVRNLLLGVGLKIIITWVLTAIPSINIQGAAIGTVVAFAVASVLNLFAARKYTGAEIKIGKTFGRPFAAAAIMGLACKGIYELLRLWIDSNTIPALVAVCTGVVLYGVMILVTKTISKSELGKLPKGDKLLKVFGRFIR
jgi:stage V sporulation protein B